MSLQYCKFLISAGHVAGIFMVYGRKAADRPPSTGIFSLQKLSFRKIAG